MGLNQNPSSSFELIECDYPTCLNTMVMVQGEQQFIKKLENKIYCSTNCYQKFIDDPNHGNTEYFDMHSRLNATLGRCGTLDFLYKLKEDNYEFQIDLSEEGKRTVKKIPLKKYESNIAVPVNVEPETIVDVKAGIVDNNEEHNVKIEEKCIDINPTPPLPTLLNSITNPMTKPIAQDELNEINNESSLEPYQKSMVLPNGHGQLLKFNLGHVNSPCDFYVITEPTLSNKLCGLIMKNILYKKVRFVFTTLGDICLAKGRTWYRVKIIQIKPVAIGISIDYGFELKLNLDQLFQMSDDVKKIPPLAFHCQLENIQPSLSGFKTDVEHGWSIEAVEAMKTFCSGSDEEGRSCHVEIIVSEFVTNPPSVNIYNDENGSSLRQFLIDSKFAVQKAQVYSPCSTVVVSPQQIKEKVNVGISNPPQQLLDFSLDTENKDKNSKTELSPPLIITTEEIPKIEIKTKPPSSEIIIDTPVENKPPMDQNTKTLKHNNNNNIHVQETNSTRNLLPRSVTNRTRYYINDMDIVELKDDSLVYIYNFEDLNRIFVSPTSTKLQTDKNNLYEAIIEHTEKESEINDVPDIGEIILGKLQKTQKYYRGAVNKILLPGENEQLVKVLVRFIDLGDEVILNLNDLKSPNKEIIQHPIYLREILLDGISLDNNLILWSDFEYYISRVMSKLRLKMVSDTGTGDRDMKEDSKSKEWIPTVKLFHIHKKGRHKTINDDIIELGKWDWEKKYENGCKTDEDMITLKNEKTNLEIFQNDLNFQQIPLNTELEMKVLIFGDYENFMCFPCDENFHFNRELRTLETQITKYCSMVKQSGFYPKEQQIHLLNTGDKWVRASRVWTEGLISIDYGTPFSFKRRNMELRSLPLDFARIPSFGLQCSLIGISNEFQNKDCIKNILKPNSTHQFKLIGLDSETGIYSLECSEVTTAL